MLGLLVVATMAPGQPAPLVPNGGFEAGTLEALPGWEKLPWAKGVELDPEVRHTGARSVRVFAHGGVASTPVVYRGGRLRVTGWVRTDSVVTGASAPWHKAALQLISYDAEGQGVGHVDVALIDGTTGWTRYETTVLLSRAVAAVEVHCHLWGEDAQGTVWFDDVSLELLDDPSVVDRKPLDLAQATVTVDCGRALGPFRPLWIGSDVGWSDRVLSDTQINAMRIAREHGFRYVRLHDMVHNPGVYSEDAEGRPVYFWGGFDARIAAVVDNGMLPVVVLEGMPPPLAKGDEGLSWRNAYPPRDATAQLKWQELIRQIVLHCREKWGEAIHEWYFEVWNEPDASGYFAGTLEEYLRLYDHTVEGATRADPEVRIGGPGGAGTGWVRPLLEHCQAGRNDATGEMGCRIDFISWHLYTVGVGVPAFDQLRLSLGEVRSVLGDLPEYRDLPTLITEWGCSSSPHPMHDRPYDAAFRTLAVREFLDAGVTLALPFCLGQGPPHAHDGYQGDLSLFTKTTIPKPNFRAFELLGRMVGTRVACDSSNDPVGGLACLSEDGARAWVMLYNLIEQPDHAPYRTRVSLDLRGLPDGQWRCRSTAIAPGRCDPYLVWEAMGGPETLTEEQRTRLLQASELPDAQDVVLEAGRAEVAMDGASVLLLELLRQP
jgi:xylan 1,4-beta-xylosidase